MSPPGRDEAWARAAYLGERLADTAVDAAALEAGRARAQAWRAWCKAGEPAFERRLASVGLTLEDFEHLLAGSARASPQANDWQACVVWLERVLADDARDVALPAVGRLVPGSDHLPFAGLIGPFAADALMRLRQACAGPDGPRGLVLGPSAEADLVRALCFRLLTVATPTLVLELNVARLRGELRGDTPQARLRYFSETWLDEPARRRAFLGEYAVLARLLCVTAQRWVQVALELLTRLARDAPRLSAAFAGGAALGAATGCRLGLSDAHRGGRGVCRVTFENGLTLMYKPRPLANDVAFQALLGWLNQAGLRHAQRTLQVLDRGEYGYVEFAAAAPCATPAEVERFYWRQGSFLALLHTLRAVDFHYENLIAAGEHPVLVDLEGLFHPHDETPDEGRARGRARRLLSRSVFGVGLLPVLMWGQNRRAADLSGLGGQQGQSFPNPLPVLQGLDGDEMRIAPAEVALKPGQNRPSLEGRDVDPGVYAGSIVAGFRETHALLRARRDELALRLQAFAEVDVRYIARPTMRYGAYLQESLHPDYLRDALERERLLDRLWAEAQKRARLQALVPAEHEDLLSGDVPLFVSRPGSRDLWDSRGRRYVDVFPESRLAEALARLAALDEADEAEQVELIELGVVPAGGPSEVSQPDSARAALAEGEVRPLEPGAALAAALRLGEHLLGKAVYGEEDVGWIGPTLRPGEHWRWEVAPLGNDLYEGLAGLALFFAHLARLSGRSDFEDLARRAAANLRAHAERAGRREPADVGVFSGRPGLVYVLWHLARLWREPSWLDAAGATLPGIAAHVPGDRALDVLTGSAGCIVLMLAFERDTGDARAGEIARACGEHLRLAAQPQEHGVGWVGVAARHPLSGFSHGAAGIAWALLQLAAAQGDERLRATALAGLEYERSLFRHEAGNWMDLREFEGVARGFHTLAWCHGAPGIALGRALGLPYLDHPDVREEIRCAVEVTLRRGFGGNQCLCHGDLGTAETVTRVANALGRPDWRAAAQAQAVRVVHEVTRGEWRCGLPRRVPSPGLMTGLAGIGYGLLRLADPLGVPCVLDLSPPPRC